MSEPPIDNGPDVSALVELLRQLEQAERERDELKAKRDSLTGWWVAKDCDDGSLILQSHTGERKHVWPWHTESEGGDE